MSWNCKATGGYDRTSAEALANTYAAYQVLSRRGFNLFAFCGVWGNVEAESGYNPWRWQGDNVLNLDNPNIYVQSAHAYGLAQWDPASKYITGGAAYSGYGPNFSDRAGLLTDGNAQLNFLDDTAVSSGQYFINPNHSYNYTYDQFKQFPLYGSEADTVQRAVETWFWNYERGTWSSNRVTAATFWYNILKDSPTPTSGFPIWLLFKIKERNEGKI